ncbi:MAG: 30S ribosomal protein S15 [Candidatus Muiribacteriota bacterium]|jgi:small subunit ribosomal protein S15
MSITKEEKKQLTEEFRLHDKDTGSVEVQIATITRRIQNLQPHFAEHKKDHHSKHGLIKLVKKRQKLLKYLSNTNYDKYTEMVAKLGLRK